MAGPSVVADAARSELDLTMVLANAVHEAKNALGMMLGSLDDLGSRCAGDACAVRRECDALGREGARVNAALVRLLALYRMEGGHYRINPVENDVDACLEECALEHESALAERGLALEVEASGGIDWPFDRDLVTSVLQGAINNAYKHAHTTVGLMARAEGRWLVLRVLDDGPGYPDAMLDEAHARQPGLDLARDGTGLGLYFASRVASAHRARERTGEIVLANAGPRGGAAFTLRLP
jgi:signal transduction histidine kinase